MVAIVSFKREAIQRAVRQMYTAVATNPDAQFHFPTGADACRLLGYPERQIAALPPAAVESFAGVGYPFAADVLRPGDRVLDVGSGSGTDALLCARLVGESGRVLALDTTASMREKLARIAEQEGVANLQVLEGDAEAIPLPDASVDAVTSNGVLNLVPDKARAIAEIFRVLKPGGRLQISDIALARPVSERFRQDPQMWAECVVGAVEEERYLEMLRRVGFDDVEVLAHFDYFAASANEKTREVAGLFNAHSVTFRARRPVQAGLAQPASTRRAAASMAREFAGVAVAVFAWLACAGMPAVVAALGAVGAGSFASHAFMFPAYGAFLGLSVWLLWRSGRLRDDQRPFWVALWGAVFAVGSTWVAMVGIYGPLGWWSYAGVAAVLAASVWSFVLGRQPGNCVLEMVREAKLREQRPALHRRVANAAVACLVVVVALYGMYESVHAFAGG
ncbi:MAG: methyltransferase domain-containing protein [Burkholderiales bacterium]|nr:MAG: methyltransferase domain-containing protein [Burkholderiales bacterium]